MTAVTTDVMLDLETLSTSPRALIVSVGAVAFDRDAETLDGPEFYRRIALDTRFGDIDAPTLEWWMARADKWPSPMEAVPLRLALRDLADFYEGAHPFEALKPLLGSPLQPPLSVWSHGAAFDVPILSSAYRACELPIPWHHGAVRDTRTLFALAGLHYETAAHHALEDAREQARAVQRAFAALREK